MTLIADRKLLADLPQGQFRKCLCICSGALQRSPTAAWVLSQPPYDFNCRAAGTRADALIKVDSVLIYWADLIICMEKEHEDYLREWFIVIKPLKTLNIPDVFEYRDPKLVSMIKSRYAKGD